MAEEPNNPEAPGGGSPFILEWVREAKASKMSNMTTPRLFGVSGKAPEGDTYMTPPTAWRPVEDDGGDISNTSCTMMVDSRASRLYIATSSAPGLERLFKKPNEPKQPHQVTTDDWNGKQHQRGSLCNTITPGIGRHLFRVGA